MRISPGTLVAEDDYLRLEASSPFKSEFVAGNIHAVTGASLRHNVIAGNLFPIHLAQPGRSG